MCHVLTYWLVLAMFGGWFWGSTWTARWKRQFCRWTLNMTVQNSVQTQLNVIRLGRNRATLDVTWKLTTEKSVHKNGVLVEVAIAFGTGEVQGEFVSEDWCRWQIEKTSKIDFSLNMNIMLYYENRFAQQAHLLPKSLYMGEDICLQSGTAAQGSFDFCLLVASFAFWRAVHLEDMSKENVYDCWLFHRLLKLWSCSVLVLDMS